MNLDHDKFANHQSVIFLGQHFRAGFLAFRQKGRGNDSTPGNKASFFLRLVLSFIRVEYMHNMGIDPRGSESIA